MLYYNILFSFVNVILINLSDFVIISNVYLFVNKIK